MSQILGRQRIRWSWSRPDAVRLEALREELFSSNLTYNPRDLTGMTHQRDEVTIGPAGDFSGPSVRLRTLQHLDVAGMAVHVSGTSVGDVVAFGVHSGPVWVLCGCRILAVEHTPDRIALTYGTLPTHGVVGQERFEVFVDERGTVFAIEKWFRLPPIVRLGGPFAAWSQRRFVANVSEGMRLAVGDPGSR